MKKPLQPPLIRIIDDDAQALEAVDFMLKCEGYSTVAYSSAAEFLVDDIPSRPGCLLSDIRMPDMMGTELFDVLLNRNYPHPVLFMTAFGDIESAVTAMKKGAVDYLVIACCCRKTFCRCRQCTEDRSQTKRRSRGKSFLVGSMGFFD